MANLSKPDPREVSRKTIAERPAILWGVPAVFMLIYSIQVWAGLDWLGDLVAPLSLGWALIVLFPVLRSKTLSQLTTYLFTAGILCFTLLESVWAIMNQILHLDPAASLVMTALYLLTNLFFLMAILQFAWLNFRHWPTIQFLLNLVTVSLILAGAVSYLYFEKQIVFDAEHWIALIYLGIDTISLAIFLALVISTLPLQIDKGFWLIFAALIQFYAADFLYITQVLNDQYIPNGLVDWLYIASILLLANGMRSSHHRTWNQSPDTVKPQISNAQSITLVILILSLPVLILVSRGIKASELLLPQS